MLNKYLTLGILTLGIGLVLAQCKPEREFNGSGLITGITQDSVSVKSLAPNPLRNSIRNCEIINLSVNGNESQVQCQETFEEQGLTFTHNVNTRNLKGDIKETLHIGNIIPLRLPLLKPYNHTVSKQYVFIHPVRIQEGMPVTLSGKYKKNKVILKGVYEASQSTPISTPSSGLIKVFVPTTYGNALKFWFYRTEGTSVYKYELMSPNVQVDKVGSGYSLEEPGNTTLIMSSDLTQVIGVEKDSGIEDCINGSDTTVPPYRTRTLYSNIPINVEGVSKKKSRSSSSHTNINLRFVLLVLLTVVGAIYYSIKFPLL